MADVNVDKKTPEVTPPTTPAEPNKTGEVVVNDAGSIAEQEYCFTDYGIVIKATSLAQATEQLKKELKVS